MLIAKYFALQLCDFLAQYQKNSRLLRNIHSPELVKASTIFSFLFFFFFLPSTFIPILRNQSILLYSFDMIHSKSRLNWDIESSTLRKIKKCYHEWLQNKILIFERILCAFKCANDPFVDCCFKHLRYVKRGRNFVPCYDVIFISTKNFCSSFRKICRFVPKIIDFWTTIFLFKVRSCYFTLDQEVVFEMRCLLPKCYKNRQLSLPEICKQP